MGKLSSSVISLVGKNFLSLKSFSREEITTLLWTAADLKWRIKEKKQVYRPLDGKSLAAIFQKRSTRTRVSTEVGFRLLGGQSLFLSPDDIHLGVGESTKDSAIVMSGFVDMILARVYEHNILEEMVSTATVPVINGLSDTYHPLQILADLLTLQEHFGELKGLKLAWVGDGNNIVNSLLMACPKLGIDLRIATPQFFEDTGYPVMVSGGVILNIQFSTLFQGYECKKEIIADAMHLSKESSLGPIDLMLTHDPREAVHNADVIVTDTWISMGQEKEKQERLKSFAGYQVTRQLCSEAADRWVFLHCLPRKLEEVSDDVFYDKKRSLVWLEAENRMWTVMAVMLHLLSDHVPLIARPKFGDVNKP